MYFINCKRVIFIEFIKNNVGSGMGFWITLYYRSLLFTATMNWLLTQCCSLPPAHGLCTPLPGVCVVVRTFTPCPLHPLPQLYNSFSLSLSGYHLSYLAAPAASAGRGGGGGRVGVQRSPSAIKQMLLDWCKAMTTGYEVCIMYYLLTTSKSRLLLSVTSNSHLCFSIYYQQILSFENIPKLSHK